NTKFISREEHEALYKRCDPERDDILLTKVGTTGIPVIDDTDKEFSLFVSVALLKFNTDLIFNKYFMYVIKAPVVQIQARENSRGVG
ncbi:restriction endonuclease, partial [Pediococcus acidilactici]